MRKVVSGIMMSMVRKGMKIIWILGEMIFLSYLYSGVRIVVMMSGGNIWEL